MTSDKFYKFVKDIAGADTILAESVIEAHKLIYGDTLTEGKLGKAQTQKYLQSIGDDFIVTNSFMDSENVEKLANYINSLPEDLKNFAISECGKFKNQFRLGTP